MLLPPDRLVATDRAATVSNKSDHKSALLEFGLFVNLKDEILAHESKTASTTNSNKCRINGFTFKQVLDFLERTGYRGHREIKEVAEFLMTFKPRKIDPFKLIELVYKNPTYGLYDYAKIFNCSKAAVCVLLKKLKLTFKKLTLKHSKSDYKLRKKYLKKYYQLMYVLGLDAVYIDESGFQKWIARIYGYSGRGLRCYGKSFFGRSKRVNVIGAMRDNKFIAFRSTKESIKSDFVKDFFENELLPKLERKSVIIMDNAAIHKRKDILELIEKSGHKVLFLPPYTPEYNPIEHGWSWSKRAWYLSLFEIVDNLMNAVLNYTSTKEFIYKIKDNIKSYTEERFMSMLNHLTMTADNLV